MISSDCSLILHVAKDLHFLFDYHEYFAINTIQSVYISLRFEGSMIACRWENVNSMIRLIFEAISWFQSSKEYFYRFIKGFSFIRKLIGRWIPSIYSVGTSWITYSGEKGSDYEPNGKVDQFAKSLSLKVKNGPITDPYQLIQIYSFRWDWFSTIYFLE